MTAILYVFLILILALSVRPIGVLLHELGHGLTSLLLNNEKVTIYIGSYADRENCYHFTWQKMDFYIKKDWLDWTHGLCQSQAKDSTLWNNFLITLFGPLASLFTGLLALFLAKTIDIQLFTFWFYMLGIAGIADFIYNIIPHKKPIILADGRETYNDGRQLLMIWQNRKLIPRWDKARVFYEQKKYAKAAAIFQEMVEQKTDWREPYKYLAYSYLLAEDELRGDIAFQKYDEKWKASSADFLEYGWIYALQFQYEKAIREFNKALTKNPTNLDARHNIGYTFLLTKGYHKAIAIADEILAKQPKYAYAYNSRGLALHKLGQHEAGFKDLEKAQAIDPEDAYIHLHFGVFYYDLEEFDTALTYFKKAEKINPNTHLLANYLEKAKVKSR